MEVIPLTLILSHKGRGDITPRMIENSILVHVVKCAHRAGWKDAHASKLRKAVLVSLTFVGILLAALAMVWTMTGETRAANITVTNLNDGGPGSLRDAIANAASGDTIQFAVTGTITLTSGKLVINKDLTIEGPGSGDLAISRNNASRVLNMTGCTGGTILNNGTLTLTDNHFYGNSARCEGGAIFNGHTLTMITSRVSDNTSGNGNGGGIYNGFQRTLTITNSTISNNTAAPGFPDTHNLAGGGGILNSGRLTITNRTVSSNTANVGTGIQNVNGTTAVSNSTISGNLARLRGGGIFEFGAITAPKRALRISSSSSVAKWMLHNHFESGRIALINTTISSNKVLTAGGGIYVLGISRVNLRNTIVAGNVATSSGDCFGMGTFKSLGHNLDSDGSCGLSPASGDLVNVDPLLGPLAYNGGPTQTHALLPGSPAARPSMLSR